MLLQQDWEALQRFQAPATQLTEVTQIIRQATACPYCGVMYDSLHAVRKHIGKSHAERGHAKTKQSYADKSRIDQEFMKHAYNGKPECAHCRKQFSFWRAYILLPQDSLPRRQPALLLMGRSRRKELLPRSPTLLLCSWLHRSQHRSLTGRTFRPQPGHYRKQTCQL